MLPNQDTKLSSQSIVAKHGTHDQSSHGKKGGGGAKPTSAGTSAKRTQITSQIASLDTEHESLKTQLKEGKAELKRLKSDPTLPKVGAGMAFRTHPVNMQAGWNAKLESDIDINRKKVTDLENELKTVSES
jgi:hypothetical protein